MLRIEVIRYYPGTPGFPLAYTATLITGWFFRLGLPVNGIWEYYFLVTREL
jgi:hypothetical protein